MSHVPTPASGDLAVHMGYVLKNVETITATLTDMSLRMATKADVQAISETSSAQNKALEARVSRLEHGRTALLAGAAAVALAAGGAGALVARMVAPVAPVAAVAKAVEP